MRVGERSSYFPDNYLNRWDVYSDSDRYQYTHLFGVLEQVVLLQYTTHTHTHTHGRPRTQTDNITATPSPLLPNLTLKFPSLTPNCPTPLLLPFFPLLVFHPCLFFTHTSLSCPSPLNFLSLLLHQLLPPLPQACGGELRGYLSVWVGG